MSLKTRPRSCGARKTSLNDKKLVIAYRSLDGLNQRNGSFRLRNEGSYTNLLSFIDEASIGVGRKNHNSDLGKIFANTSSGFKTIEHRHGNIQNYYVWFQRLNFLNGFETIFRFRNRIVV